jgi:biotin carboxyl carrier protein
MRYYVTLPGRDEVAVDVAERPGGRIEVAIDGEPVEVELGAADGALHVRVGHRVFDLWLTHSDETVGFVAAGTRGQALVESERARLGATAARAGDAGGGFVTAPMPGRVVKVLVAEGDAVDAGAPVIVVEAMKMENELCAQAAGVVRAILAKPGDTVEGGAHLVELADPGEPE